MKRVLLGCAVVAVLGASCTRSEPPPSVPRVQAKGAATVMALVGGDIQPEITEAFIARSASEGSTVYEFGFRNARNRAAVESQRILAVKPDTVVLALGRFDWDSESLDAVLEFSTALRTSRAKLVFAELSAPSFRPRVPPEYRRMIERAYEHARAVQRYVCGEVDGILLPVPFVHTDEFSTGGQPLDLREHTPRDVREFADEVATALSAPGTPCARGPRPPAFVEPED